MEVQATCIDLLNLVNLEIVCGHILQTTHLLTLITWTDIGLGSNNS